MEVEKRERQLSLHRKVAELEGFVAEALRRGGKAEELKEIVDDAAEHSRRKARMLSHADSSLLLAAVEQAKEEIGKLPEVTATNAEVMQELEHAAAQGKASSEEVDVSVKSEAGGTFLRDRLAGVLSRPSDSAGSEVPTPRTPAPTPAQPTAVAAEVVGSLRAFAAEVAEEDQRAPGPSLRTLSMGLRKDKSADFRTSRDYDFEAAKSPTATYYMTEHDFNPFRPSSGSGEVCALYSDALEGPITTDYALSSPRSSGGRRGAGEVEAAAVSEAEGPGEVDAAAEAEAEGSGAFGAPFAFDEEEDAKEEGEKEGGEGGGALAGGRRGPAVAPAAAVPPGRREAAGGSTRCAAGVPPGLNPLAMVEGHGDFDNPNTPTGAEDLPIPGEVEEALMEREFSVHDFYNEPSLTPPKHILQRLAEGVKRLSI